MQQCDSVFMLAWKEGRFSVNICLACSKCSRSHCVRPQWMISSAGADGGCYREQFPFASRSQCSSSNRWPSCNKTVSLTSDSLLNSSITSHYFQLFQKILLTMTFVFGGLFFFPQNRFRHHSSLMALGRTNMNSGKSQKIGNLLTMCWKYKVNKNLKANCCNIMIINWTGTPIHLQMNC